MTFELDESEKRPLTFRLAYRILPSPSAPTENRGILELTPRFPLKSGVVIWDRNAADLRLIEGRFSWRYRNRLSLGRTFVINRYHFPPYSAVRFGTIHQLLGVRTGMAENSTVSGDGPVFRQIGAPIASGSSATS
jgi:hypothetical protein